MTPASPHRVESLHESLADSARLCAGAQRAGVAELAEIAPALADAGYAGIELHPHHLASVGDRLVRQRIAAAFRDAGVVLPSAFVGVASDPPSLHLVQAHCSMAAALGASVVFIVPPSRRGITLAETADVVRAVCVYAGSLGLVVAVHNHAGTGITTAMEALELLERVDRAEAGICLDVAHLALFEGDLIAAIGALAPHVRYVHFKDLEGWARAELANLDGDSLEGVAPLTPAYTDVGAGALDLRAVVSAVAAAGDVWTTLEMETLRAPTVLEQCQRNASAYWDLTAIGPAAK